MEEMPNEISCPKCKEGKISMYEVFRMKSDTAKCDKCGAVATFSNTGELIDIKSEKEYEKSVCPNCGERIEQSLTHHEGYGAGAGDVSSGRSICPKCNKGCYEWSRDDIPGFKERDKSPCCNCGK